jgi:hypothetical protein
MTVAFDQEPERAAKGLDFGEAGIADFGGAMADVAQSEKGVAVRSEFREKPGGACVRSEEFDDGLVVLLALGREVRVAAEVGAKLEGEEH